jgi:hypothetical protein
MSEIKFIHQGRECTKAELESILKSKKPKAQADPNQRYHRGYRIVGHKPGAVELARQANEAEMTRWQMMSAKSRAESGAKPPKAWDEAWWRLNAKKDTVKAVDLHLAALEAKELAERYGWTEVDVIELKKGEEERLLW